MSEYVETKVKTHVNTPTIIKKLRNLSLYILVIITMFMWIGSKMWK